MKHQEQYDKEAQLWEEENYTDFLSLKAKLFALGGDEISPQPCPFISVIAGRGQLFALPITVRRMQASCCHYNVATFGISERNAVN
jgi:hypothetical protein